MLFGMCVLGSGTALAVEAQDDAVQELPESIVVQFKQGINVIGFAQNVPIGATINEAFEAAGIERPSVDGDGAEQEFKGWACSSGAEKALRNYTLLSTAYQEAGSEEVLVLFPVFGPVAKPHLTFYGQDGKTVLSEADIESWQTLNQANAAPKLSLVDEVTNQLALCKLGYYFIGWADDDHVVCGGDEPIVDDTSFTPAYAKLTVDVSGLKNAAADVSKAYLLRSGMEKAKSAGFSLVKASAAAGALKKAASDDGYQIYNAYQATMGYIAQDATTEEDEETIVRKRFGTVAVTVPSDLKDGAKVRVYWLKADGSVGRSAVKKVSDGAVSVGLSNFEIADGGNVAVAYSSAANKKGSESSASSDGDSFSENSNSSSTSSVGSPSRQSPSSNSRTGASGATPHAAVPSAPVSSSNSGGTTSAPRVSVPSAPSADDDGENDDEDEGDDDEDDGDEDDADGADEDVEDVDGEELDELGEDGQNASELTLGMAESGGDDGSSPPDEEARNAAALRASQMGSKDGGVLYGAIMVLISAAAAGAWWLAFKRGTSVSQL